MEVEGLTTYRAVPSSFCNQGIKEAEAQQPGAKTDPRAVGARPTWRHRYIYCVSPRMRCSRAKDTHEDILFGKKISPLTSNA